MNLYQSEKNRKPFLTLKKNDLEENDTLSGYLI
jgi:hypothetical protein